MPAPIASAVQQLARLKFTSFNLTVPTSWKDPQGDAGDQYGRAFKPNEKMSTPGMPPLFQAATMNKYHTDTQKMHIAKVGAFIDGICSAICSAWSKWQSTATLVGVVITGPAALGGQIVGPPLTPLILAEAPKATPMELKYSTVIATVIGTAWLTFTATVKVAGPMWYPGFLLVPAPSLPPLPNVPCPFAALIQVPVSISASVLKMQMVGQLADPQAPFSAELFESISDAFEKTYNLWKVSTLVNNVMGVGAGPGTPIVPAPLAGTGTMLPGGFT
jgi:hypothetical protein